MIETNFLKWPFPDETTDPYFDVIKGFYALQDQSVFALMNTAANVIIPPDVVSWDWGLKTLTWDADFEIPLMSSGFSLKVKYGPDGVTRSAVIPDGGRLIVVVPTTASGEVSANFQVITSGLSVSDGLFTVGFCRGVRFYANFPQVFI